jgi:hypothetical protein
MNTGKIQKNKTAILTLAVALVAAALATFFLASGPQQMVPTSTHVPVAQSPAAPGASPATEASTSATATPTPEAPRLQLQAQPQRSEVRRVILISIDAARAMDVWPLARDGFLKNIGKIAAEGAYGELSPIYPAETSPQPRCLSDRGAVRHPRHLLQHRLSQVPLRGRQV